MNDRSPMQQVLGSQWEQLPTALQLHYQAETNTDIGVLDVDYPRWMQPGLNILRWLGMLVNRRGNGFRTTVEKHMEGEAQHWTRTITLSEGTTILFKSRWVYAGGNEIIEYVNRFLGLRMAAEVRGGKLCYEGRAYVLKLFGRPLPIPEWCLLGHATIVETALDDTRFEMDFRLRHPLLGQVFRYAGVFTVQINAGAEAYLGSE